MLDNETTAPTRIEPAKAATLEGRPPPRQIKLLLPVWGYEFCRQFLRLSLPTLLAPGNVPTLARTLPTEFVFLTSRRDEPMIRDSAGFRQLAKVCRVSFLLVDDIVTEGNHSTTVTLAYARAMRLTGAEMLDTCFFFLVSDYIVADGSLASVIERIMAGASGVQAGNFQIVEDDAMPWFSENPERMEEPLILPPRDLMQWSLARLHPATIANTVNVPLSHSTHSNRLFWRVDADTLIGRFYLMHMICVRPEVTDFVVGASCDYSFIPEMCPSGNVAFMTDSDDYLVIEAQPFGHESGFLRVGAIEPRQLAGSLSEWTTETHRNNAGHTLVFHSADLPVSLQGAIGEADTFVGRVNQLLKPQPQPHRGHPYWRGAIAAHQAAIGQRPDDDDWRVMLGYSMTRSARLFRRARRALVGQPPDLKPWHPRWRDYREPLTHLRRLVAAADTRVLVVSGMPTPLTNWLADHSSTTERVPLSRLLRVGAENEAAPAEKFDACYLELSDEEFASSHLIIDRIVAMLKPGSEIIVASFNRNWTRAGQLGREFRTSGQALLRRLDVSLEEMRLITLSAWRWAANRSLLGLSEQFYSDSPTARSLRGVLLAGQIGIAFGGNLLALLNPISSYREGQVLSSLFLRLRVSSEPAVEILTPVAALAGNGAASGLEGTPVTVEPQYGRLLEVRDEIGLTPLGLMTNQVWHEDPRRLTFILARYKFVAKMLNGRSDVAELGCGDAFGTRIVQQEVSGVTVYDFDPVFIRDVRRRQSNRWPLDARVHDILLGPLPRQHNAIYSLDVIEHIAAEQEANYIRNLVKSLTEHGVLIVGTPSIESQSHASPQSKVGHVNCKSGTELKAFLEEYFHSVFVFSMNDEVVHTGYYPMAHYLLALCADAR
jgi:2-polyprenyl-3-methyl-5-hydroxy-6-metoxy-1,4-benzoquinol methylase